jgi:hypothetical protein
VSDRDECGVQLFNDVGVQGDVKEDAEGAGTAVYIKMQDGRD